MDPRQYLTRLRRQLVSDETKPLNHDSWALLVIIQQGSHESKAKYDLLSMLSSSMSWACVVSL